MQILNVFEGRIADDDAERLHPKGHQVFLNVHYDRVYTLGSQRRYRDIVSLLN